MRAESSIHRHLDAKLKVWGMEASDLLLSVGIFALMSMIFEGTFLEIPMSIIFPVLLLGGLTWAKKNKPDDFLVHALRFYSSPGYFSCQDAKDFLS